MTADDDKLAIRMAELMSSGGLGYNQISQEILYLIPREFVDQYIALWEKALGPAGMGDKMGRQLSGDAALGKERTRTEYKGRKIGAGGGGQGKRYKKFFVIRDEAALELKGRIDKRLRGMAREMANVLDERGGKVMKKKAVMCTHCGKIMADEWKVCPFDGASISPKNDGK